MTRSHRLLAWVLNLLVPGAGLVVAGRVAMGVAVGAAWGLGAGAAIALVLLRPAGDQAGVAVLAGVGAGLIFAVAQFALGARMRARARLEASGDRDARFKAALVAYLRGRLDEAEAACRELLRADPDDVEATLQLASIARRRGRAGEVRRHLARARYLDDQGRWDFEIERERAAMDASAGTQAGV